MISDTQLREDVEAELDWDTRVDSRRIGVAVKDGVVALTGHVASYPEQRAAQEAAQSVDGVQAVANDITVELPSEAQCSDSEIAESALIALKLNVAVPANAVKISVHDSWITLEGELASWHQKVAAEEALMALRGVRGITNNIFIRSPITARSIQREIKAALHRRAQVDANNIRVTTADGTVTLEGEVDSWGERQSAIDAAWHGPGVSNVIDRLTWRRDGLD